MLTLVRVVILSLFYRRRAYELKMRAMITRTFSIGIEKYLISTPRRSLLGQISIWVI